MEINNGLLLQQITRLASNGFVHALLLVVIADLVTGNLKAYILGCLNSTVGLKGLFKHMTVLGLALAVTPYLKLMDFEGVANSLLLFYIVTYTVSIFENLNQMGIPFPRAVIEKLEKLKNLK